MLVIDANAAAAACGGEGDGFPALGGELASVPLMWSEARASLHLKLHKGEIGREDAEVIHARLESCPVQRWILRTSDPKPGASPRRWAGGRTYDAEYVALATLLDCRLVTLDIRLRRGAERLGMVVTPSELQPAATARAQPLATSLVTRARKSRLAGGSLALHLRYRYGDSNPGFRTENPAS